MNADGADGGLSRLDDQDYPSMTMGQAAQVLGVQQAFLRRLDAAGVISPQRSDGGHRRYSRRQLALAERMRTMFDEGLTLDAAARIVALQDQLTLAHDELDVSRDRIEELENPITHDTTPGDTTRTTRGPVERDGT